MLLVRTKLESTYDDIWDTPHSFQYLARSHIPFPSCILSSNTGLRSYRRRFPLGRWTPSTRGWLPRSRERWRGSPGSCLPSVFLWIFLKAVQAAAKAMSPSSELSGVIRWKIGWKLFHMLTSNNNAGKILWVRSLLNHLKHFIDHFENEECLKGRKEYRWANSQV